MTQFIQLYVLENTWVITCWYKVSRIKERREREWVIAKERVVREREGYFEGVPKEKELGVWRWQSLFKLLTWVGNKHLPSHAETKLLKFYPQSTISIICDPIILCVAENMSMYFLCTKTYFSMYILSNIVSPSDHDYKIKLNSYSKKSLFYSVFISNDKFSMAQNERTHRRNVDIG